MPRLSSNPGKPLSVPLSSALRYPKAQMCERAEDLLAQLRRRKQIRVISNEAVPMNMVEQCLVPHIRKRALASIASFL
ncbi:MAG: hypothetical protein M9919_12015 [Burkholderiaceae bacterium]|jgi:hypothetical protein|nr:hypothetical protein [Burkholderiaceae bacterium]